MKKFEFKITLFEEDDQFWKQNPSPQDIYEILYDCLDSCGFKDDLVSIRLESYNYIEEIWN